MYVYINNIFVSFILPIFPVYDHGVCSLVIKETLLELRSELRSDTLPVPNITFLGFEPMTHCAQIVYSNH